MNCQQFEESLGNHSVGLLDVDATTAFEKHRALCAQCSKSFRQFQRCMELLDHSQRPVPPGNLWGGVKARLEVEQGYREAALPPRPAPAFPWWTGAAAAAAGFAAALTLMVGLADRPAQPATTVANVPPMVMSVSQHNSLDARSPVADGASIVACDAVTMRPAGSPARGDLTVLPGREALGEPWTPGDGAR